ncbi:MAG: porin family protein [Ferruginibacter sp.]
MKKIILIAAIAVCSISSYAQVSFGAQVGANLGMGKSKYDYSDPIYGAPSLTSDPKVGFLIGVLAEVPFGKLSFRPELNFVQKGSKDGYNFSYAGFYDNDSRKRTLNYIEVPLNVTYNLEIGKTGKVFFGLGPAVAIGLSGNYKYANGDKYKVKFDGLKLDDYDSPGDADNEHLKRVDVGLNVLGGFQLGMGAFAKIGYTYGFVNIDPNKDNNDAEDRSTYKNRGFNICIGYMIGGKKSK